MRYRLPEGCVGVAGTGVMREKHAGAVTGTVEAEAEAAAHLAPHGIVPVTDEADPPRAPQPKRGAQK